MHLIDRWRSDEMLRGSDDSAEHRAWRLWWAALRPAEREEWERCKYLNIIGSDGRRYTITCKIVYNVIDHAACLALCGGPFSMPLPFYDVLLAQKLLLESDAPRFRGVARWTRLSLKDVAAFAPL